MKKQTLGLVLVLASGYPTLTYALSLGDIQFSSRVNEPFKARIELLHASPQELDKLQVHIAPPSIFAQAQLPRPVFMDSLKFARSVKNGKHYLMISSSQPLVEANFNLLLEVTSPKGDLLKRYSVALKDAAETGTKTQLAAVEPSLVPDIRNTTDTSSLAIRESESADLMPEHAAVEPVNDRPIRTKVAIPLPKRAFKYKYRVRKNDTIFSIAERLKLGNLNVDEKALALYARNPQAFVQGDLTQLKLGAILRTPSAVGKKRYDDALPVPTQTVKQTVKKPTPAKSKLVPTPTSKILASSPAIIDPTLARAVHELQLASQLKLTDLQERLKQAQQLLAVRAQENNQLKDLVQEKNRLLTRREEELAELQTQVQVAQQAQTLMALGAAGAEGKTDLELVEATKSTPPTTDANTWQGVFASPLVWQAGSASVLFLLLLSAWQRRRNADQLMQLQVQNTILMPDIYADDGDKQGANLSDFLWGEDALEQAREQLQGLRQSMASLREQSLRLQAYLNAEALSPSL